VNLLVVRLHDPVLWADVDYIGRAVVTPWNQRGSSDRRPS
jgi:hypothetical protein